MLRFLKCAVNTRVGVEWEQPLLTKCPNGYAPHTASDSKVLTLPSRVGLFLLTEKDEKRGTGALTSCSGQMEFISSKGSSSRRRNTLISKPLCCRVNCSWISCVHEAGYGTGNPDINLEN